MTSIISGAKSKDARPALESAPFRSPPANCAAATPAEAPPNDLLNNFKRLLPY